MENFQEEKKIEIGSEALGYLNTTRKWTMFFAILGFIFLGLMLLGGLTAGIFLKSLSGLADTEGFEGMGGAVSVVAQYMMVIFILIIGLIYFFPILYLFRFSRHTSMAVKTMDQNEMNKALRYMKSYWVYIGVLLIIVLVIYLIIFLIAGASLAFLSGIK